MDTSETYIKMCEKVQEIQTIWDIQPGDIVCITERKHGNNVNEPASIQEVCHPQKGLVMFDALGLKNHQREAWFFPKQNVWLPRQDQLQEIMKYPKLIDLIQAFESYATYWHKETSTMEQLWLAFVMKEKFKKTWNGEDWVVT